MHDKCDLAIISDLAHQLVAYELRRDGSCPVEFFSLLVSNASVPVLVHTHPTVDVFGQDRYHAVLWNFALHLGAYCWARLGPLVQHPE